MHVATMTDLPERWVEGRPELRRRSTLGTPPADGARASGSSLLELDPVCALPRHTDSAEGVPHQVRDAAEQQTIG